jgi:hypothetical protein
LLNSAGADLRSQESHYYLWCSAGYPGGAAGVGRLITDKTFVPFGDDLLQNLVERYNAGRELVKPDSGRMEVLFMPQTMITLLWRLTAGPQTAWQSTARSRRCRNAWVSRCSAPSSRW